MFLIRENHEKAILSLNRIGMINKGVDNLVTADDIKSVVENE